MVCFSLRKNHCIVSRPGLFFLNTQCSLLSSSTWSCGTDTLSSQRECTCFRGFLLSHCGPLHVRRAPIRLQSAVIFSWLWDWDQFISSCCFHEGEISRMFDTPPPVPLLGWPLGHQRTTSAEQPVPDAQPFQAPWNVNNGWFQFHSLFPIFFWK